MHLRSLPRQWVLMLLILGYLSTIHGLKLKAEAVKVKDSLKRLAVNKDKEVSHNNYLSMFLDTHEKPKVYYTSKCFDLIMDDRFQFKPGIPKAPFSSVGDPWPMPKHYKTSSEQLLFLDLASFQIKVKHHSCDIIEDAASRYTRIIANHITEEHYEFLYNVNEKVHTYYQEKLKARYRHVAPLPDLEIYVSKPECGYPHLDMDESYNLTVTPEKCRLDASEVWGAIRGLETFSQLLFKRQFTNEIYAKHTKIQDIPRFPHRGILMDTSRHYMHDFTIKQVLDAMSYNKFNVLHWHMVDDTSFPYQSEEFPDLSAKGAFHPDLVYTISYIKEVVQYARLRGIRVVPEFDTPGHTFAWLGQSDIQATCFQKNGEPVNTAVGPINPAQERTYEFLARLFNEIYDVFPDTYVHLGGDELHSTCWATNPSITKYLEDNAGIPATQARTNVMGYINQVVGYYFKRLIQTLNDTASKKNLQKKYILWEDVLKNTDQVPRDSIMQIWLGKPSDVKNVNQKGYRVLYSNCWYMDNYRPFPFQWPAYYKCEPSPYATEEEEKGKVLGGEACFWAEWITTDSLMTLMWPRASVAAERLWSRKSMTDFMQASTRLQEQRCRMIMRGLPTGHMSGPDYCLRPHSGPLNGINDNAQANEQQTQTENEEISVFVLAQYKYLPFFNIIMSLVGVYFLLFVSKSMRRHLRANGKLKKSFSFPIMKS